MKSISIVLCIIVLASCQKRANSIFGPWTLSDSVEQSVLNFHPDSTYALIIRGDTVISGEPFEILNRKEDTTDLMLTGGSVCRVVYVNHCLAYLITFKDQIADNRIDEVALMSREGCLRKLIPGQADKVIHIPDTLKGPFFIIYNSSGTFDSLVRVTGNIGIDNGSPDVSHLFDNRRLFVENESGDTIRTTSFKNLNNVKSDSDKIIFPLGFNQMSRVQWNELYKPDNEHNIEFFLIGNRDELKRTLNQEWGYSFE